MANVERNVKEENFSRREFVKSVSKKALAGLTAATLGWISADNIWGEKPAFDITSPLDAKFPSSSNDYPKPTEPQLSSENFRLEETDPFSQEGMNENYFAGWVHMTDEQKEAIRRRMIFHSTGASIFFSTRTIMPNKYDPGAVEGFFSRINLPPLSETSRVVVDHPTKNIHDIIVFDLHDIFVPYPLTKGLTNDHNKNAAKSPPLLPLITVMLWRDGMPIQLTNAHRDCQKFTFAKLDHFHSHPAFDPERNQMVWTDGLRARGYFDPNSLITQFTETEAGELKITQYLPPRPFDLDDVILYGDRESRMRENLKGFLAHQPELFTDPAGVERYVKTGDKNSLEDILFYPQDNPVFFVPVGPCSLSPLSGLRDRRFYPQDNPEFFLRVDEPSSLPLITQTLKEAVDLLQNCGPEVLDLLTKMGIRAVSRAHMDPNVFAASFEIGRGTILINPENGLLTNPNNDLKTGRVAHMTAILLVEAAGLDCFDYFDHLTLTDGDAHQGFLQGIWKSNFLKGFAKKYQKNLPDAIYNLVMGESLNTLTAYWQKHGS